MKRDTKWKKENIIKFATWNVQGIAYKEDQLDNILTMKDITIAIATETKKKLKGTKETQNYLQFYSGVNYNERAKAGVMIMINKKLRNTITDYCFWNERIIQIRMKLCRGYLTVVGIYAPTGENEETKSFYSNLQHIMNKINKNDYIALLGDFNARIGNTKIGQNIGEFGEPTCNKNGTALIDFVLYNQLKVMNTFFNHRDSHKFTWEARGLKSIIDYMICNNKLAENILDTRVFRGPEIETDHYLLVSPARMRPRWQKRNNNKPNSCNLKPTYKVHLLRDPSTEWLYKKRLNDLNSATPVDEEVEEEWKNITGILKQTAFESLGVKRKWQRKKGLRKWDEHIKTIIEEKRNAYQKYLNTRKEEDKIEYHLKRAIAKREVRKYHRRNWEEFVSFLETDITRPQPQTFKILKLMNNEIKDTVRLNIIPKEKWITYYQDLWGQIPTCLLTEYSENQHEEPIELDELLTVLKNMKSNKAPGEDGINIELFKKSTQQFLERLLNFFNMIWKDKEPPKSWSKSIVIPIYKKGDRKDCENYRGISLLNTGCKIFSNIIKNKLNKYYDQDILGEEQNGFRKGRSCCDGYFTMKMLIEKHVEFNVETHIAFVDFIKAFDKVNRNKLLNILAKDCIPQQIIRSIHNIYKETLIAIKTGENLSDWKEIYNGVRQGCPLSPLLFNVYMNAIIQEFRNTRHGLVRLNRYISIDTLIFADDLVLLANSEDNLQRSIYNLNLVAEKYDMTISADKTKIMAFCGKDPVPSKICLNNTILERVNQFKYLGFKLSFQGEVDISDKIIQYNKAMGIINSVMRPSLVQKHTRTRLYKILARPVLSYGSEAWTLRKADENRITASEMRFMRRTAGYTKWDHKRNTDILEELRMKPVLDFIHEYQNKWCQHVNRMPRSRIPRALMHYQPNGRRSLGRPRKRWKQNFV